MINVSRNNIEHIMGIQKTLIKSKINGEILKPVFRKVADFNSYINKSKT